MARLKIGKIKLNKEYWVCDTDTTNRDNTYKHIFTYRREIASYYAVFRTKKEVLEFAEILYEKEKTRADDLYEFQYGGESEHATQSR